MREGKIKNEAAHIVVGTALYVSKKVEQVTVTRRAPLLSGANRVDDGGGIFNLAAWACRAERG
jgi:hypothetical protein